MLWFVLLSVHPDKGASRPRTIFFYRLREDGRQHPQPNVPRSVDVPSNLYAATTIRSVADVCLTRSHAAVQVTTQSACHGGVLFRCLHHVLACPLECTRLEPHAEVRVGVSFKLALSLLDLALSQL